MRRAGVTLLGVVSLASFLVGCVPQAEFDAQLMQNRKLQEQLEAERIAVADLRATNKSLRDQLAVWERDGGKYRDLANSYQSERDRLLEEYNRAKAALEAALANDQKPIVIERALPAELDTALKEFAAQHPDIVEFDSKSGVVKWKSDLVFALGSDVVKESAFASLNAFAQIVNSPAAAEFDVFIVGHTDSVPIVKAGTKDLHPTNWHLSAHRAISVKNALGKASVSENRMGISGYADQRPIEASAGRAGNERNRRVEIYLVPRGSIGTMTASAGQRT